MRQKQRKVQVEKTTTILVLSLFEIIALLNLNSV